MNQNHHYLEQLYVCSIVLAALLLQILMMMAERLLEFGSL